MAEKRICLLLLACCNIEALCKYCNDTVVNSMRSPVLCIDLTQQKSYLLPITSLGVLRSEAALNNNSQFLLSVNICCIYMLDRFTLVSGFWDVKVFAPCGHSFHSYDGRIAEHGWSKFVLPYPMLTQLTILKDL